MILKHYLKPALLRGAAWSIAALALILAGNVARSAAAQSGSQPQETEKKDEKKNPQTSAPKPAPTDGFKWGVYEGHSEFEVGYRWVSDIAGNKDMYRSMVNLGEGPKLIRSSVSLRSNYGTGAVFDRLDMSMDNWGGDPYNTLRLNISRSDLYELRADYRNLNYYNYIPTFANPLLSQGKLFGQHSLDVTTRSTDLELKLLPTRKIKPYFGYSRSAGFGPGYTTNSLTANEFALNTNWRYLSQEFHGGLQFDLPKLVMSVEQGYRSIKNDASVSDPLDPAGNIQFPFLGQPITLKDLDRGYHDRTSLPVFKFAAKAIPFEMLKVSGRYVYSTADLQSDMAEIRSGSLVSLDDRLFYTAATDHFSTAAKKPNSNGTISVEFSPFSRLSFIDQFDAKNFHVSGTAALASIFYNAAPLSGQPISFGALPVQHLQDTYLSYNQKRNQAEVELDLGHGITARAGHRYTTLSTSLTNSEDSDVNSREASIKENTAIAGFSFEPGRWMRLAFDYEHNSPDHAVMRTDLFRYDQYKFDWRIGSWKHLSANGRIAYLRNRNPQSDIDLSSDNRNYTLAVNYELSERFSLSLDYSKSNIFSDIAILLPQTLELDRSLFDERGHGVGGSMSIGIYRGSKIDFGYRGISNAGSYPLNYHQPFASISIPLQGHLAFKTYWQYFGYNEKGSGLQDYRTHLVTFGLAYAY